MPFRQHAHEREMQTERQTDRERPCLTPVCPSRNEQIHIDGLFNGDPHPGNILLQTGSKGVQRGGGGEEGTEAEGQKGTGTSVVPVLLDWGLAKTLREPLRIAFSR